MGYGKALPRNVIAKFLGPEKFAELDPEKKKETRLESGMKAVKKFIGLGEDAIIVKGVDNLLTTRARCCMSAASGCMRAIDCPARTSDMTEPANVTMTAIAISSSRRLNPAPERVMALRPRRG